MLVKKVGPSWAKLGKAKESMCKERNDAQLGGEASEEEMVDEGR